MKGLWLVCGAAIGLGLLVAPGCLERNRTTVYREQPVIVEQPQPGGVIIVREAPPPLRTEYCPPPPGPEFAWVPGHWVHDHGRYVWVDGRYVRVPHSGARWVPDRWEQHGHEWHYAPGRWDERREEGRDRDKDRDRDRR